MHVYLHVYEYISVCQRSQSHVRFFTTWTPKYLEITEKEQRPHNNSPNLKGMEISCLGSDARSYFEIFVQNPKQFLNELTFALEIALAIIRRSNKQICPKI